jgi:hypothetical protein
MCTQEALQASLRWSPRPPRIDQPGLGHNQSHVRGIPHPAQISLGSAIGHTVPDRTPKHFLTLRIYSACSHGWQRERTQAPALTLPETTLSPYGFLSCQMEQNVPPEVTVRIKDRIHGKVHYQRNTHVSLRESER